MLINISLQLFEKINRLSKFQGGSNFFWSRVKKIIKTVEKKSPLDEKFKIPHFSSNSIKTVKEKK